MGRIITVFICLLFVAISFVNIANIEKNNLNEIERNDVGGTSSNYSVETLTTLSAMDRMQYVTVNERSDGIDIVSYDDYENVWYVRENTDGVWTTANFAEKNSGVLPLDYFVTAFGFFSTEYRQYQTQNCSGTTNFPLKIHEFTFKNMSNGSGVHSIVEFCGEGLTEEAGGIASADHYFSFGFTTCNPRTNQNEDVDYMDRLIVIHENGSNFTHSSSNRNGLANVVRCSGGSSYLDWESIIHSSARPKALATNQVSCLEVRNHLSYGSNNWGDVSHIECITLPFNNSQTFSANLCYRSASSCPSTPYYSTASEIHIIEAYGASGSPSTWYSLWVINQTGIHELPNAWIPSSCTGTFSHIIGAPLLCSDDTWWDPDPLAYGQRIWYPGNNSTDYYPYELTTNQPIFPFTAQNIGSQKHWLWYDYNPIGGVDLTILWSDFDMDSHHDLEDDLPLEPTQYSDQDGDGYGDSLSGNNSDGCPSQFGNSTLDQYGCRDIDGDGWSDGGDLFPRDNRSWSDADGDEYPDQGDSDDIDDCPQIQGESFRNGTLGCLDADFDGWADSQDSFPDESSQWMDTDFDGYGDNLIGLRGDSCVDVLGNSTEDRFGCPDADGDGWSDDGDDLPAELTQWKDRDGDGYGDSETGNNPDAFPSDGTQWNDTDGDGHGDNPYGSEGDWFPHDSDRWQDTDRDGIADEDDEFINDATQWNDTDGDGYGDESSGNRPDVFPNDPTEWMDSDDDGLGNNADDFPFDPTQWVDSDGDGMGDNPMGIGADNFPDDITQWGDIDGDGYGDNQAGNNPDAFFTDSTQWADSDGDGYGDNPAGRLYDLFPNNPTQWEDADGDGLGDNLTGTDADPYLNDFDNDGYNDSIDILPKLASPGDLDNDGCMDENDTFPANARECSDYDGDGV
ncbi:MAG: hypothetical protein HN696_02810, partial [Euryarchaeota archaeon]|nr:hypothetical protein [Euryarchaeota archaeon]